MELFPTAIRFSGVAICYNLVYTLAGFTPLLLSHIILNTKNLNYTAFFFMILAGTTLLNLFFYRIKKEAG